jgi:three-Cys-motif partner protein
MAKKLPKLWPLQPHTKAKHVILRKYLQAWMRIMTLGWNYSKKAVIIDGFAGPGEYEGGEDGSPIIILKECINYLEQFPNNRPQLRFIFIEQDYDRFLNLKAKVAELFNVTTDDIETPFIPEQYDYLRIFLLNDSFEKAMSSLLAKTNGNMAPTFAFIDPFGFKDTPYYLIEQLNKNDKSEVFVNFMYEDINRFLKLPSLQEHYHRLFGTEKWMDILKHIDNYTAEQRRFFLHSLYKEQLHQAGFKYVLSFEMKNERNATDYFLYYGTNHIKGLEKMKDAMWTVDKSGAYTFSDYEANRMQLRFVEFDEPDLNILADEIHRAFTGQTVLSSAVKDFVVTDTVFRRSVHSTAALKILEKQGVMQVKGRKGKSGYPDNCQLIFI